MSPGQSRADELAEVGLMARGFVEGLAHAMYEETGVTLSRAQAENIMGYLNTHESIARLKAKAGEAVPDLQANAAKLHRENVALREALTQALTWESRLNRSSQWRTQRNMAQDGAKLAVEVQDEMKAARKLLGPAP